jgi:serine/threonine protein kinase
MFCSRCGTEVQSASRFCPTCGLDLTVVTQGVAAAATMQAGPQDDSAVVREALKDEYELEKELGRGGMAIVYKARDKSLEREVAIKVLPFSLSFDAEFVERFQREARTAAKLEHPNIIPIYRVGKSGRVIYFVMKFLRGKPLSSVIEARGALPVPEIKRVLIEAARALGYAHKHGIVHRDIKPDNIMFDELGQAIVTDFGIAKAQSGARLTGTGMSIGTPHYMSPEQARAQTLDGRSDVYSLGVVGYQCLTGHVPFDGEDSFSIGYKHIMEELPTPPLETPEQRELFGVVQRMMAKKAEERFQTAEEVAAALEGSGGVASALSADVATRPTEAVPMASGMSAIASAATTPLPRASVSMPRPSAGAAPRPAPPPRPRPPKKKSHAGLYALLAVALVAVGLGAYWYFVLGPGAAGARPTQLVVADSTVPAPAAPPADTAKAAPAESAASAAVPPRPTPRARRVETRPRPQAERATRKEPPRLGSQPERAAAAATASAPSREECDRNATVSLHNPDRACYDTKPNPLTPPVVAVPSACVGTQPPVSVMVHVSATGDVVGTPTPMGRSRCPQFRDAAVAQALDLRFAPARKSGQPVSAWTQVLIRPARH